MRQNIIVILGGGLIKNKNGQWRSSEFEGPVFASHLRVLAGSCLFKKDSDSLVIASGGKGYLKKVPGAPSIAQVMKKELLVLGVPSRLIVEEKNSNNTRQSVQKIRKVLSARQTGNVIIITNQYHLNRVRTFINQDLAMKNFLRSGKIKLIAAEAVVQKNNPELKNKIKKLYQSKKMKAVIGLERAGIRQIKNGTYNLHSNNSLADAYK